MSLLSLSTSQIIFQSNDSFKTVQMINQNTTQSHPKPIMYKIKTNKIDYVDAKPSCGYISALKGQNQLNVIIRSLTNKKQFTAKLQILYVSHDKITQELVQKNKKHFDIQQYNEIYDSIKQGNQSDVKTAIINVIRKGIDINQQAPIDPHSSDSKSKLKISQLTQSIKDKTKSNSNILAQQRKGGSSLKGLLGMLLIGLLVGFLLGAKYGGQLELFDNQSPKIITQTSSSSLENQQITDDTHGKIEQNNQNTQQVVIQVVNSQEQQQQLSVIPQQGAEQSIDQELNQEQNDEAQQIKDILQQQVQNNEQTQEQNNQQQQVQEQNNQQQQVGQDNEYQIQEQDNEYEAQDDQPQTITQTEQQQQQQNFQQQPQTQQQQSIEVEYQQEQNTL